MAGYYVNDSALASSDDHEVHISTCDWLLLVQSKTYLGDYPSCADAVVKARTLYPTSNGCAYCCPDCHGTQS